MAYAGFVNGDTVATAVTTVPVYTTTATSASPASPPTYPSSYSAVAAPNYLVGYLPGAVTVNKATSATSITAITPTQQAAGLPSFYVSVRS